MLRRDSFTERLGVAPRAPEKELDAVPNAVRDGLLTILRNTVSDPRNFEYPRDSDSLYWLLYRCLFTRPSIQRVLRFETHLKSQAYRVPDRLGALLEDCRWNIFFDAVEACAEFISETALESVAVDFEYNVNELLLEHGLQWQLRDVKIERRRPEPVAATIEKGLAVLAKAGFEGPNEQLRKAIRALDQRPEPDLENCVKDAVGALEGTALILVNKPKASLSDALQSEPLRSRIHGALRDALLKIEGYRSDAPGAGHAMGRGKRPVEIGDAEFVLTTCVAGILLLVGKAETAA